MEGIASGTVIAGKYRLDRPLAQGGMGAVWTAFDTALEVPVAVKFMAPALARLPDLVGRFEREAKAAAQLRSPHVVQVFEHGVDPERGLPYIVMERLEGEDLGKRLKRRGRLSLQESAAILEQVCKALRKAHEAGIVHRDLKPSNIYLARHDEDEIVKVLDFGIAKSARAGSGEGTQTGVMMGSPAYMSPEQARSAKGVDHRSDLWSLGLVAFRMVTGKAAFAGETDADTLVRLCSDPVPVPSEVAPDLPPEVDAWFEKALSREVDRRFSSAKEMAATFGRIAGRAPSIGDFPPPGASMPAVSSGVLPAIGPEVTASDVAPTVPRAALPIERTAPFPANAWPPSGGATLTNAGSEAVPARSPSRGAPMWGIGAAGALAVVAATGWFALRTAGHGSAARASAEAAASPAPPPPSAPPATATPPASAPALPVAATSSAGAPLATVAPAIPAPPAARRGPVKPGRPAAAKPAPGADGTLDIPRVLGKER